MKKFLLLIPFLVLLPQFAFAQSLPACVPTSSGDHTVTYATPTTGCAYTVPTYGTLTVQAWGGGGGGGGGAAGGNGQTSSFAPSGFPVVTANGGMGASNSTGGTAQNGDINTNGYNGGPSYGYYDDSPGPGGAGGASPNGGSGGTGGGGGYVAGGAGNSPGGGGGGMSGYMDSNLNTSYYGSGGGGGGAYSEKSYSMGQLTPGVSITLVVGSGGTAGASVMYTYPGQGGCAITCTRFPAGGAGAPGQITITWTQVVAPACSVSLDQNPVAYGTGGTTLRWSSSNTTGFYIHNVGYVIPNTPGSAQVQPSSSTDYTGTATTSTATVNCTANSGTPTGTLNVKPPSNPTATLTSSLGTTMQAGQSSTITATFYPGNGDALTADNVDGDANNPAGWTGGRGADTSPTNPKSFTFNPTQAGTYTFYARAQTSYFTSWATYGSPLTITVTNPPSCTPATSYSCPGGPQGVIRTTATSTQCVVTTTDSSPCPAPSFCSAGSSSCLYRTISFNQSGGYTGQLQVIPTLVKQGGTVQVHWNVADAQSCSVVSTNLDSWSETASPGNGETSKAIIGQTTYTLSCQAYGSNPGINESQTVNVAPTFEEK